MEGSDKEMFDIVTCEEAVLSIPGYRPPTPGTIDEEITKMAATLGEQPVEYKATPLHLLTSATKKTPKPKTIKTIRKLFGDVPASKTVTRPITEIEPGVTRQPTMPVKMTTKARVALSPIKTTTLPKVVDHRPQPLKRKALVPKTVNLKGKAGTPVATSETDQPVNKSIVKHPRPLTEEATKQVKRHATVEKIGNPQLTDPRIRSTAIIGSLLPSPPPIKIPRIEVHERVVAPEVQENRPRPNYDSPAVRAGVKKRRSKRQKYLVPEGNGHREMVMRKGVATKGRFIKNRHNAETKEGPEDRKS